jgi:hypothetical protein
MLHNLLNSKQILSIITTRLSPAAAILTVAANISPGFAQERLVPTSVDSGDCVASIISTTKTAAHRKLDRQYCTDNNIGSPQKIQICRQNLAKEKQITFFSDRCSNQGVYSIGIDGVEYQIKQIGGNLSRPPYLTGSFSSKDLRVNVKEIRSIQNSKNTDGIESGKSEVLVTIIRGVNTKKIKSTLSYGP